MLADHDEPFSAAAGRMVLLGEVGGMPLALQLRVPRMPAVLRFKLRCYQRSPATMQSGV
jgi:hypothetical protein